SGRNTPIMDAIAVHVYGESSKIPPSFAHPRTTSIGIADYGKLVHLIDDAFGGTPQPSSELPIVYGEYGVETTVPDDKWPLDPGSRRGRPQADRVPVRAGVPPGVAGLVDPRRA